MIKNAEKRVLVRLRDEVLTFHSQFLFLVVLLFYSFITVCASSIYFFHYYLFDLFQKALKIPEIWSQSSANPILVVREAVVFW